MSKLIRICALSVIASVLFGAQIACNTTEGAGKDMERAGEKIQDTADRNK